MGIHCYSLCLLFGCFPREAFVREEIHSLPPVPVWILVGGNLSRKFQHMFPES